MGTSVRKDEMPDLPKCFSVRCRSLASWGVKSPRSPEEEFYCGTHATAGLRYATEDDTTAEVRWVGVW